MKRKCEACPAEVMAVCRHAFGKFWNDKSTNGEGCDFPLDDVADAWRKAGWTPDARKAAETAPARFASGGRVIEVAAYADATDGRFRASGAIAQRMPRRPKRVEVRRGPKPPVRPMEQQQLSLPIRPTLAKHERRSPIWH